MSEEIKTDAVEKYESGLPEEKHNRIAGAFNEKTEQLREILSKASAVQIADVNDKKGMTLARELRLKLKNIRVDVEKTRKALKEESLREGKAIDGMANIIKYLIVPAEERLQEQEDTAKRIEAERIAAIADKRRIELENYEVDCSCFDLGAMTDEAYETLRSTSEAGHKAKKAAEEAERKRLEDERIAKEKAEAEQREKERKERERIEAENSELRKKQEEAERRAEEERKAREAEAARIEAERQKEREAAERKAAEERKQQEAEKAKLEAELRKKQEEEEARKAAEVARIKADKEAEQKKLAAPDKEKLDMLKDDMLKLSIPSVSSDDAIKVIEEVRNHLNAAYKAINAFTRKEA